MRPTSIRPRREATVAVDYVYGIGKYEVTAGAVHRVPQRRGGDRHVRAVQHGDVVERLTAARSAAALERLSLGSYTYKRGDANWANRPVNYVSLGRRGTVRELAAQRSATGNGDTENGAYYLNGGDHRRTLMAVTRNADAKYWIPTENEWYKAAYHKNDGVTGNYCDYPTSSDSVPSNDLIDPDPGNNANFYQRRLHDRQSVLDDRGGRV